MGSFADGFCSPAEAKAFGNFSTYRALDKFIIEYEIPIWDQGSTKKDKTNYLVHKESLQSALMTAMTSHLTRARTKKASPELTAWRKANGGVLAHKLKMDKETDEAKKKTLNSQLGGLATKAKTAYEKYEASLKK